MCCISLACNMHRDTARRVDQCSNNLQRGTCAKNTVRFLKNNPCLTCPQCTLRIIQYTAPSSSESLSCDNDEHLIVAARDDSDLERSWAQEDVSQPFPTSQVQVSSSVSSCSRPASTQFDFQLLGYPQLGNDDLGELSHEDGIQLIDEMYGAEHSDYSMEEMDTNDDKMFYIPAETHYDLEQAHNMINEIKEIMQNGHKGAIADASIYVLQQHGATPTEGNDTKKIDIEASMFEARELLDRAQQELDKLWLTRQEIESDLPWCLEKYITPTQVSVDSRL